MAISASDSIFAYLVSSGADDMPPLTNVGFIAGPLLIAVAARTTAADHPTPRHARRLTTMDRAHLLLPYVLVALTGSVVAVQSALGDGIDAVETVLTWIVLVLVLARQVVTLLENAALLDRLSASQAELSHQAHHDPLTGLANRALFSDAPRGGDRAPPPARRGLRRPGHRPRRLQGRQRRVRPRRRRPHAATRSRNGCAARSAASTPWRGWAATSSRSSSSNRPRPPAAPRQRILAALRPPFSVAGHTIPLGASVGVVEPWPEETGVTPDVLVNRADRAMYAGKRDGKGIAVHYRPELARTLEAPQQSR